MRVEIRRFKNVKMLVLVVESAAESTMLDEVFGSTVNDGVVGVAATAECRLADGYGEHYILINPEEGDAS